MRKLWIRRRGVSTMIGGMIILALFMTALTAMVLVNQQYDSYQTTVNRMQQNDANGFAENLRPVPPALARSDQFSVSCAGGNCNTYTMTMANIGIGVQIARVYINSTGKGCTSMCVLDASSSPSPNSFDASSRFLNPGETRSITLWLPGNAGNNVTLPDAYPGLNTVVLVTTRGRVFSFQWPLPPPGPAGGISARGPGGTGIYIGPLVISFQKALIAYTYNSSGKINVPQGGTNGHWSIPSPPLVIYVKIQTDIGTPYDVYLTAQAVLELAQFNSPGNVFSFFIVAPITPTLCETFRKGDPEGDIVCNQAYGYNQTAGNNGDPNALKPYLPCDKTPYSSCPNRYLIPRPNPKQLLYGLRGDPVIVAFAAKTRSGDQPQPGTGGFSPGTSATSFLGLTYVYNDGTGVYTYALTLPFIAFCINDPKSNAAQCPG
jgi:hypothetical protein